jgi:hypothetical protein
MIGRHCQQLSTYRFFFSFKIQYTRLGTHKYHTYTTLYKRTQNLPFFANLHRTYLQDCLAIDENGASRSKDILAIASKRI